MKDLEFDPATHTYRRHGQRLISVTQALKAGGLIDDSFYTEEARLRGQHVHEAAHFFDDDDLDMGSVRPEIRGYLDAYISFRNQTGFYPILSEQRLFHSAGFAGTLDRVGWLNDRLIHLDLKTGSLPDWAGPQTAGYDLALNERIDTGDIPLPARPEARFALQLSEDGKFKLWPLQGHDDVAVFLAALKLAQWKGGNS
jgi:hypothetical protein